VPRAEFQRASLQSSEVGPRDFEELQQRVEELLDSLYTLLPLLDANFIEEEALSGSSADNQIAHGLGRKWKGIIPVNWTAQATWQLVAGTATYPDTEFINIQVDNASTLSFFVF